MRVHTLPASICVCQQRANCIGVHSVVRNCVDSGVITRITPSDQISTYQMYLWVVTRLLCVSGITALAVRRHSVSGVVKDDILSAVVNQKSFTGTL